MKMTGAAGEAQLSKDASPMRAAEEPPNQVFPNQRERLKVVKKPFYCLGMHLVPLSNYGILLNSLYLKENQKLFARIKIDFVVRNTRK